MAKHIRYSIFVSILASLSFAFILLLRAMPVDSGERNKKIAGRCERVVDGDSLYIAGHKAQVRLWGVDAPERGERGYLLAKDTLSALAKGNKLHCTIKDIDKYQRAVARCFVQKSDNAQLELNRALLEAGVAREYCWFSKGFYGFCGGEKGASKK